MGIKKLEARLGLGAVVAISIGSMLGSGIFVLPAVGFSITGPSLYLAFLLAAITILPAAVSKSELASAMPSAGGTYIYLERTFGPLAGTVAGLGLYLSMLLKASFALVGFSAYLSLLTEVPITYAALTLLLVIVILNIMGVGKVSGFVSLIVATSILTLISLSGASIPILDPVNFKPLMKNGSTGLLSATALVFVAYAGVTKVAAIAEEIKNPRKNLPRGILFSMLIVTFIYCSTTYVLAGSFPISDLAGNLRPIHSLAELIGGHKLGITVAVIAVLTMTSQANAAILSASRFPFAMGRDNLLPARFGRINSRFLTPVWSILLSGCVVTYAVIFLDIEKIAKLASSFMILIYMTESIAVIVLRETRVQWYQPAYKSFAYPLLQLFGIASSIVLLFAMGQIVPIAIGAISVPGLLLYILFSRKRTDRIGVLGIRLPRKDLIQETNPIHQQIEEVHFTEETRVVVALFGHERSPEVLTEMGLALADDSILEVIHMTEIPEQTDLDDIVGESVEIRSLRRRVNHMALKQSADIRFDPIVSHDIFKTVNDISQRLHCEWLVTEWGGKTLGAFTLHNPMGWLRDHLSCHLMTFRDKGVRYFKKLLVIVQTDKSNELLLNTADHLARVNEAEITLTTYAPIDANKEVIDWKTELLEGMSRRCKYAKDILVVTGANDWSAYAKATDEFDMVIIEAESVTSFYKRFFGSSCDKLMEHSACSILSVQPSDDTVRAKNLRRKIIHSTQSWRRKSHFSN